MPKFPADVPKRQVLKALAALGFRVIRQGAHISLVRENADGTRTPLTIPNHRRIKGSTLHYVAPPIRARDNLAAFYRSGVRFALPNSAGRY